MARNTGSSDDYNLTKPRTRREGFFIREDLGASEVWPGLWVARALSVIPRDLPNKGITLVFWATPEVEPPNMPPSVELIRFNLTDEPRSDISKYFPTVTEKYRHARRWGGSVMMVCRAGISRSSTLALACMMLGEPWTTPEVTTTLTTASTTTTSATTTTTRAATTTTGNVVDDDAAVPGTDITISATTTLDELSGIMPNDATPSGLNRVPLNIGSCGNDATPSGLNRVPLNIGSCGNDATLIGLTKVPLNIGSSDTINNNNIIDGISKVAIHPSNKYGNKDDKLMVDHCQDKIVINRSEDNDQLTTTMTTQGNDQLTTTMTTQDHTQLTTRSLKDVYMVAKENRRCVRPNRGFFEQLIKYEVELRGSPSVQMVPSPYNDKQMIPDIYLEEVNSSLGATFSTFVPI